MIGFIETENLTKKFSDLIAVDNVSLRVNDVRSANNFGIFIFLPFLAIYLASEIRIISLDINGILIITGILSAIDIALYFVSKAAFQREEILTKWK